MVYKIYKNINNTCGQSTVEFAIVLSAFVFIIIALGLLWNLGDKGILVEHALRSASHHLSEAAAGIVGDLFSC